MEPLETYLAELRLIRSSGQGVAETSYYPPLSALLNDLGKSVNPRVHCVMNIKNRGVGLPDGGLFTSEQFQQITNMDPLPGQLPARGVIEVKPTADDAWVTADGEQVTRYWGKYRQVLVTNLRDFVLVGEDADGKPRKLESYRLGTSEVDFWAAATTPHKSAEAHGKRFGDYIRRVMLQSAPITTPQDLAWILASHAREAGARIEGTTLTALDAVRKALEEALGLQFEGERGDHFFRSTLVQTLFYGIFAGWVLWCKENIPGSANHFRWHETPWWLHVPMIRALFEQVAAPSKLGPLGLDEVLNWSEMAINRVDRASFFQNFEESRAVQYFYEPFLQAFDPQLRKDLGVWYTPPEVVQYMVARVDKVLRESLDLADGLANPNVYVLDPCTGTGSYLVEVLKRIQANLEERGGGDALVLDFRHYAVARSASDHAGAAFCIQRLRRGGEEIALCQPSRRSAVSISENARADLARYHGRGTQ